MKIWKFMLIAYSILIAIFAYLVFVGVHALVALCIFIYPTELFGVYIFFACKQYGKDTKMIEIENKDSKIQESRAEISDGDVSINTFFGDLWVVDGQTFIKINDGYTIEIDELKGFVKVRRVDSVANRIK